mmetsp:Transcript_23523/g.35203  ORF Transcript_23523/g.35203 Transcript_23523/m.35203 type:complete len:91 (+) Transcript_23523:240-512(+)
MSKCRSSVFKTQVQSVGLRTSRAMYYFEAVWWYCQDQAAIVGPVYSADLVQEVQRQRLGAYYGIPSIGGGTLPPRWWRQSDVEDFFLQNR